MREEPADIHPALTVFLEAPMGSINGPDVVELGWLHLQAEGFAMLLVEPRLRVEAVYLGDASVHIQKDDAPGLRGKMSVPGRERPFGLGGALLRHQHIQRESAETYGAVPQHLAAGNLALKISSAMHCLANLAVKPL